jgi:copper chaperone
MTFKTNINCSGCVAKVAPALDQEPAIQAWKVDTSHPDKLLSVESETLGAEAIVELVKAAGFQAEPKKKGWFGR